MTLSTDIWAYVDQKFGPDTENILKKLEKFTLRSAIDRDHMLRCIVFLSQHSTEVDQWIERTHLDPRDVIMEAEYVLNTSTGESERVRDLSLPF